MDSILTNEKWFWKTIGVFFRYRFVEQESGSFMKKYHDNTTINFDIENYTIDYGKNPHKFEFKSPSLVLNHKDIVVLDCVDKLLSRGYRRKDIVIIENTKPERSADIILLDQSGSPFMAFSCFKWGDDYQKSLQNFKREFGKSFNHIIKGEMVRFSCIYSSYLDGGLHHKTYAFYDMTELDDDKTLYHAGIFEGDISGYEITPRCTEGEKKNYLRDLTEELSKYPQNDDYLIRNGEIIEYNGSKQNIKIPDPVIQIGMGAFWNCTSLKSIEINEGVIRIGGDAFYKCINLETINIPSTVREIGNDPFAGCPNLTLENKSRHFILENGVLYDRKKFQIIHYPIKKKSEKFEIPSSVRFINKHAFYENSHLRTLVIPENIIWIENNLFSGCDVENVINHSPYFCVHNGVLYNQDKTQVFSVFLHKMNELILPSCVRKIGKNSFYGCKNLEHLHISKNVNFIGYNPFVGCSKLELTNESPKYTIENGMLINRKAKLLMFCPNSSVQDTTEIPNYIEIIGRNSFSYCVNLKTLIIPDSVKLIERGAFGGCSNLRDISIPDSVKIIEKWAFSYCKNLYQIHISKKTKLEEFIFAESPTRVIRK